MAIETQVGRWGNSLAIRLPRAIAETAKLSEGDHVSVEASADGGIVLRPAKPKYSLEELVDRITPKNRHGEFDWGPAKGREAW